MNRAGQGAFSGSSGRSAPTIPDHQLVRRIGSGAFGEVWLARNLMKTWRAVKIVWRDNFVREQDYARERSGVAHFEPLSRKHPGLVHVLHVGVLADPACFYYVMEIADDRQNGAGFSDAGSYAPYTFERYGADRRRLPFNQCVDLAVDLASALHFLHSQGFVHRDIKPSSVIVVEGIPKLADIGLVTSVQNADTIVGTRGYIPPEGPGSPQADLYALGKLLYELAFGRDRDEFPELPPNLESEPEGLQLLELNDILVRACAPRPADRYATANQLLADLRILQSGKSVRRIRNLEHRIRWSAFSLIAVVISGLTFLLVQHWRATNKAKRQLAEHVAAQMVHSRQPGWRDEMLKLISDGGGLRDRRLRDLAIANLRGLDAKRILYWTNSPAATVAFDKTGTRLAVGGPGSVTQRVPLDSPRRFEKAAGGAIAVAFAPENQLVELRSTDGLLEVHRPGGKFPPTVLVWPALASAPIPTNVSGLLASLSADGGTVVASREGQWTVWDSKSGAVRFNEPFTAAAAAVSPDGSCIAAASAAGEISLRELDSGAKVNLPSSNHSRIDCLALARDFVRRDGVSQAPWLLAAGDSGGCVTVWDCARRTIRSVMRNSAFDIYALAFNPDSTLLCSGGRGDLRLWDVAAGQLVLAFRVGDFFTALSFSPDGRRLAATTRDKFLPGETQVWQIEPDRGIRTLRGLGAPAERLAVSRDDRLLTGLSHDWHVGIWDLSTGLLNVVREVPRGFLADSAALEFSPDGNRLAFESGQRLEVFDARTGAQAFELDLPEGRLNCLRYDAVGRLVSFRQEYIGPPGAAKPVGRVRDLFASDPLKPLVELAKPNTTLVDAALSPDGTTLAVVGQAGAEFSITILDALSGAEKWHIASATSGSARVAFDTQGDLVNISFARGPVSSYRPADGLLRRDIPITGAAMARGGRLTARSDEDFGWTILLDGKVDFALGIDQMSRGFPLFNNAGTMFVWANWDGTLSAADLISIRRQFPGSAPQ